MKRWKWILPMAVLLALVASTSVWSYDEAPRTEWTELERVGLEDPVGLSRFSAECQDVFNTIRSTLATYISTVVTVVAAIVGAIKTVVVSIVKFTVRFALTIVKALVQWLVAAIF